MCNMSARMTPTTAFNMSRDAYMELILDEINSQEVSTLYPLIVFYALILCIGLFGNALVILVYSYRFRVSPARVYILYLAAIDFSICLFGLPYHLIDLTNPYTYTNTSACKSLTFIMTTLFHMSIFGLIVIAIDRYLKICKPLGKLQISYFGKRRACFCAFIFAILLSWPNLVLYGRSEMESSLTNITGYACFFSTKYLDSSYPFIYIMTTLCVCIGSTGFLVITYSLICHRICTRYKKDNLFYQDSPCLNDDSEYSQIELHNMPGGSIEYDLPGIAKESNERDEADNDILERAGLSKYACQSGINNVSKFDQSFKPDEREHDIVDQTHLLEQNPGISEERQTYSSDLQEVKENNKGNALFSIKKFPYTIDHQTETKNAKLQIEACEDNGVFIKGAVHQSHESLMKCVDKGYHYPNQYGSLQHIPRNTRFKGKSLMTSSKSQSMRVYSDVKDTSQHDNVMCDLRKQLLTGNIIRNEGMRIHSRSCSTRSTLDGTKRDHSSPSKQHGKITRIMLTVTIVFVVSYTPALVITIWTSIHPEFWDLLNSSETIACEFFLRIYLINNICNPFIYGFWDKRFKREIVYTFRKIALRLVNMCSCRCCNQTRP